MRDDLWVTELVLTYDGIPSCAVSIMEFREGLVADETQYSPIGLTLHPRVRMFRMIHVARRAMASASLMNCKIDPRTTTRSFLISSMHMSADVFLHGLEVTRSAVSP
jgi:hypothetical protein